MKVGIDLVKISRLSSPSSHFLNRILTEEEHAYYENSSHPSSTLAGIWAAKEAYLKAIQKGLGFLPFKEIMVHHYENEGPSLEVCGEIYPLSISHDGGYAVAVVIIP